LTCYEIPSSIHDDVVAAMTRLCISDANRFLFVPSTKEDSFLCIKKHKSQYCYKSEALGSLHTNGIRNKLEVKRIDDEKKLHHHFRERFHQIAITL